MIPEATIVFTGGSLPRVLPAGSRGRVRLVPWVSRGFSSRLGSGAGDEARPLLGQFKGFLTNSMAPGGSHS